MAERLSQLKTLPYLDAALALGLPLAWIFIAEVVGWVAGSRSVGTVELTIISPAALTAYILTAVVVMRRVATDAFATFRVALGDAVPDPEAISRSLSTPPTRATIVAVVGFELFITGTYLSSPAARASVPDAWPDAGFVWAGWMLAVAAFATIIVFAIHQLRIVVRLHEVAPHIDLFRPAPINAFSRLTVTIAIALLPLMLFGVQAENPLVQVPAMGLLIIASFVLPLRGMHGRLVREKRKLLDASTSRFEVVRTRLHAAIDGGDLSHADELQAALAAVLTEREVIAKLPTWPWTATIFRGFASAVLVPILLWLAIRLLERFV